MITMRIKDSYIKDKLKPKPLNISPYPQQENSDLKKQKILQLFSPTDDEVFNKLLQAETVRKNLLKNIN